TKLKIYVNGERFEHKKHRGKRIKSFDWATLHKVKTINRIAVQSSWMAVRIRGMHMFDVYVDSNLDCQLTLELEGNTRELLTSNRDGLQEEYRGKLQAFIRDICVNIVSSLE